MKFSHATLPFQLCMIMGLLLAGCSKQKEGEKPAATTAQSQPRQPQRPIKASAIPEQQSSQQTDGSIKVVALVSINAALEPLKHGADLLQTIRAGWNRFEHPHFATAATSEKIHAAIFDPPIEFLKTTRSAEVDSSLRTALVGRLSLLTAYLGEGGEGDDTPIRVLSVLSDTVLHPQATEGDVMSIRMLKCAAQLRTKKSTVSDSEFRNWIEFAKSPNVAARALAIMSMQFVSPSASQSYSLFEGFDDEQEPDVQVLLIDYLRDQPGEGAAIALKKFCKKWPTSDVPIKGN